MKWYKFWPRHFFHIRGKAYGTLVHTMY